MNCDKFRYLREKRGLLQKEVAIDLNISPSTIGMYEQGRREADHNTLKKIANYFNVSIDYLLDNENKEYKEEKNILEKSIFKKTLFTIGFLDNINEDISKEDIERLTKFIKINKEFIKQKNN